VAAPGEKVDHLAEDADLAVGEALRQLVEEPADDALERACRRVFTREDLRQQHLGVPEDEQTFPLETRYVPARRSEPVAEAPAMFQGRDDERRLTRLEAGGAASGTV
jgi:hypothetical protein